MQRQHQRPAQQVDQPAAQRRQHGEHGALGAGCAIATGRLPATNSISSEAQAPRAHGSCVRIGRPRGQQRPQAEDPAGGRVDGRDDEVLAVASVEFVRARSSVRDGAALRAAARGASASSRSGWPRRVAPKPPSAAAASAMPSRCRSARSWRRCRRRRGSSVRAERSAGQRRQRASASARAVAGSSRPLRGKAGGSGSSEGKFRRSGGESRLGTAPAAGRHLGAGTGHRCGSIRTATRADWAPFLARTTSQRSLHSESSD